MRKNIGDAEYKKYLEIIKNNSSDNYEESEYLKLLLDILHKGVWRDGRNASTCALFAKQLRFKTEDFFPAFTTKKLFLKGVIGELLWFLEGSTNDNRLKEIMGYDDVKDTIWSKNAKDFEMKGKAKFKGDLGNIYGRQWRNWVGSDGKVTDQIESAIKTLKKDPNSRRIVVSAWNPGELGEMALPPCHMLFHFFSANGKLSLAMTQRSCDMFLGVPFNIASYALLLQIISKEVNLKPDELVITFNDAHIYESHTEQVIEQIQRKPYKFPKLNISNKSISELTVDDFSLENYEHHPTIKAEMIV